MSVNNFVMILVATLLVCLVCIAAAIYPVYVLRKRIQESGNNNNNKRNNNARPLNPSVKDSRYSLSNKDDIEKNVEIIAIDYNEQAERNVTSQRVSIREKYQDRQVWTGIDDLKQICTLFKVNDSLVNSDVLEDIDVDAFSSLINLRTEGMLTCYGLWKDGTSQFVVFENVQTETTFEKWLTERSPKLNESDRLFYALSITGAMKEVHKKKLFLTIFTLDHIFFEELSDYARIKICTIGACGLDVFQNIPEIQTRNIQYSVNYGPPELDSSKNADTRSDMWYLGLVLWRLFDNGTNPFTQNLPPDKMVEQIRHHKAKPTKPAFASDKVYECLKKCWETSPAQRCTSDQLYLELNRIYTRMNGSGDMKDEENDGNTQLTVVENDRKREKIYVNIPEECWDEETRSKRLEQTEPKTKASNTRPANVLKRADTSL